MDFTSFSTFVQGAFPSLTPLQLDRFARMEGLYGEWNARINVISRKDIGHLYDHHVLHSLAIARYLQERRGEAFVWMTDGAPRILDLGTGGGFPGIPLAVLFPNAAFTLCDSVGKKTLVARSVAQALGLKNVTVVQARAEQLGQTFDFIVSRAVASLDEFYPWVRGRFTDSILYLRGGDDVAQQTARLGLPPGRISTWRVESWLQDPYFAGKYVIDIAKR